MKKLWIDIMFGDRFHRKFKYGVDTAIKTWAGDLVNYTLEQYPYLRRRKEFDLFFDLPNMKEPVRLTVRPDIKRVTTRNH